jgi:hypothetical protein
MVSQQNEERKKFTEDIELAICREVISLFMYVRDRLDHERPHPLRQCPVQLYFLLLVNLDRVKARIMPKIMKHLNS